MFGASPNGLADTPPGLERKPARRDRYLPGHIAAHRSVSFWISPGDRNLFQFFDMRVVSEFFGVI